MKKFIFLSTCCLVSGYNHAAANDLFLTAAPLKSSSEKFNINASVDAVNKTIDFLNLRQSQGPVADGAGDYIGGNIGGHYIINDQFSVEGNYWYRNIDYSQDTNTIHSWLLATRYTPPIDLKPSDHLVVRLSTWGDFSKELTKSTPTQVANYKFQSVQVKNPNDIQAQIDTIFSRRFDTMNQLNGYFGIGYSKVSVDEINAQMLRNKCLFDLNIARDNQVTGNLNKPCVVNGVTVNELSFTEDASNYNLDVKKDLNYDAFYTSMGISWNWRYRDFESQIAYQYQRLWRQDIDDRISNSGTSPVKDNHSFGLKLSYDINPRVTAFLEGQVFERNFVGTIPFLYNQVTASRLDRRYGLASLGITFHGF